MRIMWVVFWKEFLDIIRDRRRFILTVLSLIILMPALFILPTAFLATRTTRQSVEVLTIPVQGMDRASALIAYLAEEHDIHAIAAADVEALVKEKQYPAGLIIPEEYEEKINTGHSVELIVVTDMRHTVNVRTTRIQDALEEYGEELMQARLRQRNLEDDFFTPLTVKQQNVATSTETAGSFLGLIIPGIVISFALSAGMPIAVSSIAGEKKKLTLEPVLFTPVNRFQLVFAKLMAVLVSVIITLITLGISTVIMVALVVVFIVRSLPADKMAAAAKAASDPSTSALAGGYHLEPMAILLFFVAPFLIILLGAAIQILVSAWARNDEEATTYLAPLSLFSGAVVFITMFLDDYTPQLWHYALPVFGTILSMRDLLSNNVDPLSLALMFGTSTLYALLMIVLAVWMFHREEVVFRT